MNDQELESGLRAMYRAEVSQTEPVPLALQRDVAAIPRTATTRRHPFGRGRSMTLLAAAALLLVGGALAVGSGVLRRTPVVPPGPTTPRAVAIASAPPTVEASPNVAVTPTPAASAASPSPASDMQPIAAGRHILQVLGTGTYPSISVKVPEGWYDVGGQFVNAGPNRDGELSVWDVGQVFRHPCHWQGQAFDPGPTVSDLVKAFQAQPTATGGRYRAGDIKLGGYSGSFLERRVSVDPQSCDVGPDGAPVFQRWPGYGTGRQQPVDGQMDQLYVIDVEGQRLVVDATKFCCGSGTADELSGMVSSIRFATP